MWRLAIDQVSNVAQMIGMKILLKIILPVSTINNDIENIVTLIMFLHIFRITRWQQPIQQISNVFLEESVLLI